MDKNEKIELFKKLLKTGKVEFIYKKKDESMRTALGTMAPDLLPKTEPKQVDESSESKPKRKLKEGMVFYYDLDKEGYRSFHIDQLSWFGDSTTRTSYHLDID